MCLGMSLRTVGWPAASLLQAQGRFKTRMRLSVLAVAMFFPATITGTWLGGVQGLAIAVAVFYSVMATIEIGFALRPGGQIFYHLYQIFTIPLVASALAAIVTVVVGYVVLPQLPLAGLELSVCQFVVISSLGAVIYVALIRSFAPDLYADVKLRIRQMVPTRR